MASTKLFPAALLAKRLASLHRKEKRVVFTNGCFDLLHPGHIYILTHAKALGDVLVVGSVKYALDVKGRAHFSEDNHFPYGAMTRGVCQESRGEELVDAITVYPKSDQNAERLEELRPTKVIKKRNSNSLGIHFINHSQIDIPAVLGEMKRK